jgi:hypothetical protein
MFSAKNIVSPKEAYTSTVEILENDKIIIVL